MSEKEEQLVSTVEVFEEARKYSSSQRRALIEELETDIRNLAHSIGNLYDEHTGVFLMHGVQIELKFSVFNEVVYRQVLGCPCLRRTRMSEKEEQLVSTVEVFEEARKYSSSQRRALIEELETDIRNLAHSIGNLYDEHTGVFLMHGVQVELKFSVFNEVVYRQFLGCPEFYDKVSEMAEEYKEVGND